MKFSKTSFAQRIQTAYRKALHQVNAETGKVDETHARNGIGRREFIATTSMAAAALMLTDLSCRTKPAKQNDIAIIGGGIAGLNAAHTLSKFGIKAMIYEASDRAGGRIYTQKMENGLTRELGGEFVDTNHYEMLALIDEFELEKMDCVLDNTESHLQEHLFFFQGKERSETDIINEFKKYVPAIEKDKEDVTLTKLSLKEYLDKIEVKDWFYDLLYWSFTAEFGLPAEEQNALNFISMVSTDTGEGFKIFGDSDERFKIKGGNEAIIGEFTKRLKDQILYGQQLTAISKTGDQYKLTFENKEPVTADYVIITIPFTMLRNVSLDRSLNIPADKIKIIQELGYGTNSKLLLETNNRAWRAKKSSGYVFNEVIHNGWDNSQLQKDNEGIGGYTVFLGGKAGAELSDDPGNIAKYTPEFYKAFELGAKDIEFKADPKTFNWSKHKYTGGSYACYKTNQWDLIKTISEPVENIFFAGEHCSEKFQGFMNGGAETGRVAAEKMLAKIYAFFK